MIVENREICLKDYRPHSRNYNKHPATQIERIAKSLQKFGQVRSVVVWRNYFLAGHGVREAALSLGWESLRADVLPDEYSETLALAYVAADNELGRLSDPDQEQLAAILSEAKAFDAELLQAIGYDDSEFDKLLAEVGGLDSGAGGDAEPQVDKAEELRQQWGVELGQMWALGEHRLICGDCTDPRAIARVTIGKVNLLFTSPPYWVGMDYETQKSEQEINDFIRACVRAWTDSVDVDKGRIVINTGSAAIHRIDKKRKVEVLPLIDKWQAELRQRGWLARHWRIWAKSGDFPASIAARSDVVDQHWEHIVAFDNEFSFLGTWWAPSGEQRGQEKIGAPWAQQGVWADIPGQRSGDGNHIAAFPVELPRRNILLYTQTGEKVLDPFGGSGTTMIACQNLGRTCCMSELSPAYCGVILQRFVDAFQVEPRLIDG